METSNQQFSPEVRKQIKKFKILFWVLLVVGVVGFLDFLSKPIITSVVENYYGREIDTQVSFLMSIYMDLSSSGMGALGLPFLWAGIGLSSGLWVVFLIAAYFVRQRYKKLATIQNQSQVSSTEETKKDLVGYKKLSPRLKWVVVVILVLYLAVLLFAD